jgi:hypothetical protein
MDRRGRRQRAFTGNECRTSVTDQWSAMPGVGARSTGPPEAEAERWRRPTARARPCGRISLRCPGRLVHRHLNQPRVRGDSCGEVARGLAVDRRNLTPRIGLRARTSRAHRTHQGRDLPAPAPVRRLSEGGRRGQRNRQTLALLLVGEAAVPGLDEPILKPFPVLSGPAQVAGASVDRARSSRTARTPWVNISRSGQLSWSPAAVRLSCPA